MKKCTRCGLELPLTTFHRNGVSKLGEKRWRSQCASCIKELDAERYRGSQHRQTAWQRQAAKLNALKLNALSSGCYDCDASDIRVLEFDHRPSEIKSFDIGGNRRGVAATVIEIKKCDVVCANCHRIRTIERGLHWKSIKQQRGTECQQ